jgi:hypothetical protein
MFQLSSQKITKWIKPMMEYRGNWLMYQSIPFLWSLFRSLWNRFFLVTFNEDDIFALLSTHLLYLLLPVLPIQRVAEGLQQCSVSRMRAYSLNCLYNFCCRWCHDPSYTDLHIILKTLSSTSIHRRYRICMRCDFSCFPRIHPDRLSLLTEAEALPRKKVQILRPNRLQDPRFVGRSVEVPR